MTRLEAQQAYTAAGSTNAIARVWGCNQSTTVRRLKVLGVELKPRGYSKATAARIRECREPHLTAPRPCVIHDLPGSCDICRERYRGAGISGSGTGETEMRGAGR